MTGDPIVLVFTIIILIYSIIFHEISHGYAAYLCGDTTAKDRGRLSLNPIPHIDPVGSIMVPLVLIVLNAGFLFGWAKPVPVNPFYFRNRRRDEIIVSLAGPMANFALIAVLLVTARILYVFFPDSTRLMQIFFSGMILNFVLGIFNLIPIPPLDGSHVVRNLFMGSVEEFYRKIEPFGFLILMGVIYFGVAGSVIMFLLRYFYRFLMLFF